MLANQHPASNKREGIKSNVQSQSFYCDPNELPTVGAPQLTNYLLPG